MINPEDLMRTIVFAVSWTVLILRTPAAIRPAHQRWIWLTVTAQSVVTLIDLRPVTRFIDAVTGIAHSADLSKHLAALVFLAALLAFIFHVRASGASIPAWQRWIPFCLAGATALIMVAIFPFAHPTRDRFLPPPATWDVLDIYWAPFLIYYAVVTALAALLFWGHLKQVPPLDRDLARQHEVGDAWLAASRSGDFDALVALLAPNVVRRVDGGTRAAALSRHLRGAAHVAGQTLKFGDGAPFARRAAVNGSPGIVSAAGARVVAVMVFTIADGRIHEIDILADPDRLCALRL